MLGRLDTVPMSFHLELATKVEPETDLPSTVCLGTLVWHGHQSCFCFSHVERAASGP